MALLDYSGSDSPDDMSWLQQLMPSQGAAPLSMSPAASGPGEVPSYISQAAAARNIDPSVALKVWQGEGSVGPGGQSNYYKGSTREPSYGPFQLYMGGGLGNEFQQQTGLHPGDPSAWKQTVDFALDKAKNIGWGPWFGAKRAGITGMMGIGQQGDSTPASSPATQAAIQDNSSAAPYDAAQESPGALPSESGSTVGPGATLASPQEGAPFQAPAAATADSASSLPPDMASYMKAMTGGDTTSKLGEALMAIGTGLPGSGFRQGSQTLLEMAEKRRDRMLDMQEKMYPQMMAYQAFIKQGVPPAESFLRSFAPGSLGKWTPHQVGTDNMGNPQYVELNDLTGERRAMSGDDAKKLGLSGGSGDIPDSLVGPDRLKAIEEKDPAYGALLQQGLAGELDPTHDFRFQRNIPMMTNFLRQSDLVTRDPNNPSALGDYDPVKMRAARQQYSELTDMKSTSPGGLLRGADQGVLHFGQAITEKDAVNKNLGLLSSNSWGPLTSILNEGKVSYAKLEANPQLAGQLPPALGAAYETAKFFKGNGALSDADAEHFMAVFKPGMSPEQQEEAYKQVGGMLNHAYETYYNKYQQNPKSFTDRYPFPAQFSPGSLSVFKRLGIQPAGVDDKTWGQVQPLGDQASGQAAVAQSQQAQAQQAQAQPQGSGWRSWFGANQPQRQPLPQAQPPAQIVQQRPVVPSGRGGMMQPSINSSPPSVANQPQPVYPIAAVSSRGGIASPAASAAPTASAAARPANEAEYSQLPSGTLFIDPEGVQRIKP